MGANFGLKYVAVDEYSVDSKKAKFPVIPIERGQN
jgi:hypothetical protein